MAAEPLARVWNWPLVLGCSLALLAIAASPPAPPNRPASQAVDGVDARLLADLDMMRDLDVLRQLPVLRQMDAPASTGSRPVNEEKAKQ